MDGVKPRSIGGMNDIGGPLLVLPSMRRRGPGHQSRRAPIFPLRPRLPLWPVTGIQEALAPHASRAWAQRWMRPAAVSSLVVNVLHRRDRRRGPADRLRAGLPDLAAVHRAVVRAAPGHGHPRRDRVRQPDADLRRRRRRDRDVRGRLALRPAGRPPAGLPAGARRPRPGGHRRDHGAHRPQPVDRVLPPARLAGDGRPRGRPASGGSTRATAHRGRWWHRASSG